MTGFNTTDSRSLFSTYELPPKHIHYEPISDFKRMIKLKQD